MIQSGVKADAGIAGKPVATVLRRRDAQRVIGLLLGCILVLRAGANDVVPTLRIEGLQNNAVASHAAPCLDAGTNFGNHAPGAGVTRTFILGNEGDADVDLIGYRSRGSRRFEVAFSTARINPGAEHSLTVTFRPEGHTVERGEIHLYTEEGDPMILRLSGSSFDVDPATGTLAGGNRIRITGELPGGGEVTGVQIAGTDAEFRQGGGLLSMFRRGPAPINVTVPAGVKAGPVDITLSTAGQEVITLPAVFTYE